MLTKCCIHEDWRHNCHSKVYQSPRLPRRNRTHAEFASWTSGSFLFQSENIRRPSKANRSEKYEETCSAKFEETRSGNIDFRIQGLPHSSVQKEDHDRRDMVKKLIHQFETHPNSDSLTEDSNKTEDFKPISEKSKELITSMGNTDYFELCETSSKRQCPDCSLYWDVGIVYCTFGKCLQPSERNRQLTKDRYDVLSIPGYVIKKEAVPWSQTWTNYAAENLPQTT